MSKLQSSIQNAIEKVRETEVSDRKGPAVDRRKKKGSRKGTTRSAESSGIFRAFRLSQPDETVMEESKLVSAIEDRQAIAAYKVLRTRVLQRLRSHKWRKFLVTGSGPGEGKTLTASNLALSISKDVNQSVFLVDLDLRRSSVSKYFGLDVKAGISDYLMGKTEIENIVHTPLGMDRIAVIPNLTTIENSSELIASPRMGDLIEWLENQSDRAVIIFDMPPVLACDDVLAFSPNVDAILFVVTQGVTNRGALEKASQLLADSNLLGVVLNRSLESGSDSDYGYYSPNN